MAGTEKSILEVSDVAEFLNCSYSHASNLVHGKVRGVPAIPHVKMGRLRRIRREALMEWFLQQETAETTETP